MTAATENSWPTQPEAMPEPQHLPNIARYHFSAPHSIANVPVEYHPDQWEPGDPLYRHGSSGYSRRIASVLADRTWPDWDEYWCRGCDVAWKAPYQSTVVSPDDDKVLVAEEAAPEAPCWLCGRSTPHPFDEKEARWRQEYTDGLTRTDTGCGDAG